MKVQAYKLSMVREHVENFAGIRKRKISNSRTAGQIISEHLKGIDREAFVVLALDSHLRPVGINTASVGTLNVAPVYAREVFKFAILASASSIIVGHNHPSGDRTPSDNDKEVTMKLLLAAEVLGIPINDHIIVAESGVFSFQEEGLLLPMKTEASLKLMH